MNVIHDSEPSAGEEVGLVELVEQITARLQAGQSVDVEDYARRYPEYSDRLRQWVDIMATMASLGSSLAVHPPQRPLERSPASAAVTGSVREVHMGDEHVTGMLGDFRILQEIGRGGMGVVYEAQQISLGRRVALKVLPFAAMLDKQQLARFRNEARAAATLDHPHVVSIYSVGTERGVHYYAMHLVEGQSLAELLWQLNRRTKKPPINPPPGMGAGLTASSQPADQPQSEIETRSLAALRTIPDVNSADYFRTVAELGIQAAEALDHAHRNGIIHRDVKPGNLLLDMDGKLWVTDFGLARIEGDAGMTLSGDVLGTLRYMSPEQALANRVVVDHRTDVYSLGVTLYELLALQPAFGGEQRPELLRKIAFEDPRPLRKINSAIPSELETIVHKAVAKSPAERFPSAEALAEDLRAFLEHRPIKARRPSLWNHVSKWSRRHRGLLAVAAALLVVLTVGSLASTALLLYEQQRTNVAISESRAVIDFLVNDLLAAPVEEKKLEREITVSEVLVNAEGKIATALADQPLVEATVRDALARSYQTVRKPEKAEPHARRAWELRTKHLGPINHDTLQTTTTLVEVLTALNKPKQARQLSQNALETARHRLGPQHADTVASLNRMVWVMIANHLDDDLPQATKLCDEALDVGHRFLGATHRETLRATSLKADLLESKGEAQAAVQLLQSAVTLSRQALGSNDRLTLSVAERLAQLFDRQLRHRDATKLFEDVLQRQQSELGAKDPAVLHTMKCLAESYTRLNRFDESRQLLEQAIGICEELYGKEHWVTVDFKLPLAHAVRGQGNFHESAKLDRELVDWERTHQGPEAESTLWRTFFLAYDLLLLERHDESLGLCDKIIDSGRRALPPDAKVVLQSMGMRARILYGLGKQSEARQQLQQFVEAIERNPKLKASRDPYGVAGPRIQLAGYLIDEGQLDQAQQLIDHTIAELSPYDWTSLNRLAWMLVTRQPEEIRDAEQALELITRACELTDYKIASVLDTLAGVYAEQGNFAAAVQWSEKALELAQPRDRERYIKHLEMFRSNKPWRQ